MISNHSIINPSRLILAAMEVHKQPLRAQHPKFGHYVKRQRCRRQMRVIIADTESVDVIELLHDARSVFGEDSRANR
jgi:hypothetical protein